MSANLGMQFLNAVAYSIDAHAGQVRKGTNIPYITHPFAVAGLILEFGGDEDLAVAGLLHDVIEDCDPVYAEQMQDIFGGRVTSIVRQLTDGVPGEDGEKAEWRGRKQAHIEHMKNASPDVLLVAACDKLHNVRCLLADVRRDGLIAFAKFRGGIDGTLWHLLEMARATSSIPAGQVLMNAVYELSVTVDQLTAKALAETEGGACH